ncbi:hypothetical protein BD779DRAFT_1679648 [Infundibulicybe gibba]|nr:hypothetical protein BD779DRAFT_1679648 [Infundibulicybe gibba]
MAGLYSSAIAPRLSTPNQTPRASLADLETAGLPPSSPPSFELNSPVTDVSSDGHSSDIDEENECMGQSIKWQAGSVWDTYAYAQHDDETIPWAPIRIESADRIVLQSKSCKVILKTPSELQERTCSSCSQLRHSPQVLKMIERASGDAPPHTNWKYLNARQVKRILSITRQQNCSLRLKNQNFKRKEARSRKNLINHQRIIMLVSQNKIAGVSRILDVALRNGASAESVHKKLESAIAGVYAPRSRWTDREYDIAFLIKALGGARLLYTLQKADAYPSRATLHRRKVIPELTTSAGIPNKSDINANLNTLMCEGARKPPANPAIGQVFLIDGTTLESVCRFDLKQNCVIGLCREHSHGVKISIDEIGDVKNIGEALESGVCHRGKDGTVAALAPVTSNDETYFPVPLIISASCKSETGEDLAKWIETFLETYRENPNGEKRHGPIQTIATDGESSFRKLRFVLGLSEDLNKTSDLGRILYALPGLNCNTGRHGILGTCDPKHIVKRFATMLRSPTGIQVDDTFITNNMIFEALTHLPELSNEQAHLLLNPSDKQNVPKAVNLLQSLFDLANTSIVATPAVLERGRKVVFISRVLNFFLFPFIKVEMSLSEQIRDLSAYIHLITALFRKHNTGFMTSALYADSQAIVKNVLFTVARLQLIDLKIKYYILLEGTDRLEQLFSHVRTQDHSRNFDLLQLTYKLSTAAEINAIFERYPDLDRGHIRRDLINARGVDHINPKSWVGDVSVGSVDIKKEYFLGREVANAVLAEQFGPSGCVDFDAIFADRKIDHLRPLGKYVGSSFVGEDSNVDKIDDEPNLPVTGALAFEPRDDLTEFEDMRDTTYSSDSELSRNSNPTDADQNEADNIELNPTLEKKPSQYLETGGAREFKPTVIARLLQPTESDRKLHTRLLRVQGKSLQDYMQRYDDLNQPDDFVEADGKVKSGDLGAVLSRIDDKICLTVVEVLNFRRGSSKANLPSVSLDDLDAEDSRTTLAIQILQLSPGEPIGNDFAWIWTKKYIQITTTKKQSDVPTQRHFATRIPGSLFHPLAPKIVKDNDDTFTWALTNSDLKETFEYAWGTLDPGTDEIITNITMLPLVVAAGANLPYRVGGAPSLCMDNIHSRHQAIELKGDDEVICHFCDKKQRLRNMRNHVGKHILHSLRNSYDASLKPNAEASAQHHHSLLLFADHPSSRLV